MRNLNTILLFVVLGFSACKVSGQSVPSKYWVQFTDRNNSPYSLSDPGAFLSQKAIDRRALQGITLTEDDLPVNPAYVDSIRGTGVTLLNRSKWFNAVTIFTLDTGSLGKIAAFPFVKQVQRVALTTGNPYLKEQPGDKNFETVNALEEDGNHAKAGSSGYDYGPSFNQIHMVSGDVLHEAGYRGQGMVIAVLDAGFVNADTLHVFDSLRQNGQILGTRDFVNPGGNVYTEHWHGMMVLSIMAGNVPGQLIGTAPRASYWLLRSEDANSEYLIEEDNWATAAEFADSVGADIITTSLGYNEFWDPAMNHTYHDMDGNTTRVTIAADMAASKGILVLSSAGNSGGSPWQYITAPADGDSVLTVGTVDSYGAYAFFSSTGPTYDGRIKPDVSAQGVGTVVATTNGGFAGGNGTSFSCPVVAGMAACLWQSRRSARNMEVFEAIRKSGNQYLAPDSLRGYGIPDFTLAKNLLESQGFDVSNAGKDITVHPNPFSDRIFINVNPRTAQTVCLEILDASGKAVRKWRARLSKNTEQLEISGLGDLAPGLYLLKAITAGGVTSLKLLH